MASTCSLLSFLSPLSHPNTPQQSSAKLPSPNSLPIPTKPKTTLVGPLCASNNEYPDDQMPVISPSILSSNILLLGEAAYNVEVAVEEDEPEERLLNRFRREVMRAGVIQECKRRRFFENKQEEKKRKNREAARRNSRRRRFNRGQFQNKEEPTKVGRKDDDEDNWDMPDVGDAPTL